MSVGARGREPVSRHGVVGRVLGGVQEHRVAPIRNRAVADSTHLDAVEGVDCQTAQGSRDRVVRVDAADCFAAHRPVGIAGSRCDGCRICPSAGCDGAQAGGGGSHTFPAVSQLVADVAGHRIPSHRRPLSVGAVSIRAEFGRLRQCRDGHP